MNITADIIYASIWDASHWDASNWNASHWHAENWPRPIGTRLIGTLTNLGSLCQNTTDLHARPGIPCSWILCPCLEQKPTRAEGWRRNQQLSPDHNLVALKPTPVFHLPVLAGIAPAGIRRKAATLALARKTVKHDWHILHDTTKNEVPPCRLKSRKPYNKEAQEMISVIPEDRSKDAWIAATWKHEWEASGPTRVLSHSK